MHSKKYTDKELASVTPEQLANVYTKPKGQGKVFTLRDKLNPGIISQVTEGKTTINPGVTGLRNEGAKLAGGLLTDLRSNRGQTIGDPNDFINRRTDPLRNRITQEGDALTKRLDQTGVTGEFAQQTQESFQASANKKLAQGELLALDEFTALSNNLDQTEGGMLRLMENIDFSAFTQELQSRGLSQDLKNQLVRLEQGRIGIDNQQKATKKAELGGWLSLIASFF